MQNLDTMSTHSCVQAKLRPLPCENEVGFIGTVLELSGTHFNGTFWDNH